MPAPTAPDPMAVQMAQLLLESDEDELREIVKRWLAEAGSQSMHRVYEQFGARLVELRHALAEAPVQPTRAELEEALTIMLRLAAQSPGGAQQP